MRLRKKNVSRVAAVAVAAVMAVSAAAPAAFAAAPAANGGTAVVQESGESQSPVYITYYDGTIPVGAQTVYIDADTTYVNSRALTAPEGYELCEVGDLVISNGSIDVAVVKKAVAPATQDVEVTFYDYKNDKTAGTQIIPNVSADQTTIATSELTLPEGYEFETEKPSYDILNGYVSVAVVKKATAPATRDIEVVFYDYKNDKTAGKQIITNVSANETTIATSELTLPEGYEFETEKDSYDILDRYVNVAVVKKAVAPATQDVEVVFYDFQNGKTAGKQNLTLSADKTSVAASELKLPEGYEFETEKASYDILNGYVNVAVVKKAVATTKVVKINFYSEDEEKQIAELRLIVAANATSVNSSALTAPKGYELCEVGDFAIRDGYVFVPVRKATTKVVKINFYSEDEEKQIAEPELTVAADATSVNSSALTAPEGYELCEVGDFAIRDGYVYVPVRKATTPDPVDPTPTPDPEPTPAPTVNPVTTALGVGTWLLILGGLVLGFLGL